MALLYDRILSGREELVGFDDGGEKFTEVLAGAPVVNIDNVTAYYEQTKASSKYLPSSSGEWRAVEDRDVWAMEDFPNLAPPFSVVWFEHRYPFGSAKLEFGVLLRAFSVAVGELVRPADAFEDGQAVIDKTLRNFAVLFPNGGWMMSATVFEKQFRSFPVFGVGRWMYGVHKGGAPWRNVNGSTFTIPHVSGAYREAFRAQIPSDTAFFALVTQNLTRQALYPTLLATSFMHCKNVVARDVEQPAPLSKKWQKKHGRPLVRYKVLDIDPMRKVLRAEGRSDEVGLKKALHICRGHFATYTEEAPLFGRLTGTFWKPQHVRGSAQHGVVVKDYNVKAPR